MTLVPQVMKQVSRFLSTIAIFIAALFLVAVIVFDLGFAVSVMLAVAAVGLIAIALLRIKGVEQGQQVVIKRPWGTLVTLKEGLNWYFSFDVILFEVNTYEYVHETTVPGQAKDGAKVTLVVQVIWRYIDATQAYRRFGEDPKPREQLVLYAEKAIRKHLSEREIFDVWKDWNAIETSTLNTLRDDKAEDDAEGGNRPWGVEVTNIAVDHIDISPELITAFNSRVEEDLMRKSHGIRHEGFIERVDAVRRYVDNNYPDLPDEVKSQMVRQLVTHAVSLETVHSGSTTALILGGTDNGHHVAGGVAGATLKSGNNTPEPRNTSEGSE